MTFEIFWAYIRKIVVNPYFMKESEENYTEKN